VLIQISCRENWSRGHHDRIEFKGFLEDGTRTKTT